MFCTQKGVPTKISLLTKPIFSGDIICNVKFFLYIRIMTFKLPNKNIKVQATHRKQ